MPKSIDAKWILQLYINYLFGHIYFRRKTFSEDCRYALEITNNRQTIKMLSAFLTNDLDQGK